MTQEIESDKLFIKDIFKQWYRIPEYQRPYVWGTDQVGELLDDIYRARQSNPNSQYFLGSMVLKKSTKNEENTRYEEYDVLDGQQRLTTLFLIFAVVRDLASTQKRIKTCSEAIYTEADSDCNIPERIRIIFDIRDDVKDFVDEYIKVYSGTKRVQALEDLSNEKDKDISIRNMENAILTIRKFFVEGGNSLDEFFPFFCSNVLMIYVATEEIEDAFHLFTVMNNRGVRLRHSDILKAENLAKIEDGSTRINYAKKWESIEEFFAEDFDNFLSHLRTILVKQKAGHNLLKEYEDNIYAPKEFDRSSKTYTSKPALLTKGRSTFDFIDRYYKHYIKLFNNDNYALTNSFELCNQLTLMKSGFEADYWIAALLKYYDKYHTSGLLKFLYLLDAKFSSDLIIGLTPTERIESINTIIKEIESTTNIDFLLTSPVFKVEAQELIRILSGAIYGRRYARYILLKVDLTYHGHTTEFVPPKTVSIEHILPQTPDGSSEWASNFTEDDRQIWTNRLGNLILISRRKNSALGNLDYLQKKDKYLKKNIELFSNSIRIFSTFATWNLHDLKSNHRETLTKVLSAYGLTISSDDLEKTL